MSKGIHYLTVHPAFYALRYLLTHDIKQHRTAHAEKKTLKRALLKLIRHIAINARRDLKL